MRKLILLVCAIDLQAFWHTAYYSQAVVAQTVRLSLRKDGRGRRSTQEMETI